MTTVRFDTLKVVERLENAGVPNAQARAQASVLADVISAEDSSIVERFASKQDVSQELAAIIASIEKLDLKIEKNTEKLDSKIDKSVAEAKVELIRWVVSVGIVQIALISGLVSGLVFKFGH